MPAIRSHLLATPHTGIRRMLELATSVSNPLMLISGDPNFGTPIHIIDAAAKASVAGKTGYAPAQGLPEVREAMAAKVRQRNKILVEADQVSVTTGACGALFTSLMVLLDAGDEVLVPDPGWSNYAAMLHVLSARAIPYPVGMGQEGFLDVDHLASLVTPRTKVVLLNSPSNPSGEVADPRSLAGVLALAEYNDLWVLSDEAYDEILFDGVPMCSPAALGGADRVVTIYSLSKTYAMTGWRLGYTVGPRDFITQLSLHQEPVFSSAPTFSQHGALAALTGDQTCVHTMRHAYQHRRDAAVEILDRHGVDYILPGGAFFLMVDIRDTRMDSWKFAERLLTEAKVGVVPGYAFGHRGEGYIRVSLAAADGDVIEGVGRIARMIKGFV